MHEKENIFTALRDNEILPKEEKSFKRLADEGYVLIAAGSETVAQTLSYTTFYVLNTPGVLQKLRTELKGVMPRVTDISPMAELEKLPYLVSLNLGIASVASERKGGLNGSILTITCRQQ